MAPVDMKKLIPEQRSMIATGIPAPLAYNTARFHLARSHAIEAEKSIGGKMNESSVHPNGYDDRAAVLIGACHCWNMKCHEPLPCNMNQTNIQTALFDPFLKLTLKMENIPQQDDCGNVMTPAVCDFIHCDRALVDASCAPHIPCLSLFGNKCGLNECFNRCEKAIPVPAEGVITVYFKSECSPMIYDQRHCRELMEVIEWSNLYNLNELVSQMECVSPGGDFWLSLPMYDLNKEAEYRKMGYPLVKAWVNLRNMGCGRYGFLCMKVTVDYNGCAPCESTLSCHRTFRCGPEYYPCRKRRFTCNNLIGDDLSGSSYDNLPMIAIDENYPSAGGYGTGMTSAEEDIMKPLVDKFRKHKKPHGTHNLLEYPDMPIHLRNEYYRTGEVHHTDSHKLVIRNPAFDMTVMNNSRCQEYYLSPLSEDSKTELKRRMDAIFTELMDDLRSQSKVKGINEIEEVIEYALEDSRRTDGIENSDKRILLEQEEKKEMETKQKESSSPSPSSSSDLTKKKSQPSLDKNYYHMGMLHYVLVATGILKFFPNTGNDCRSMMEDPLFLLKMLGDDLAKIIVKAYFHHNDKSNQHHHHEHHHHHQKVKRSWEELLSSDHEKHHCLPTIRQLLMHTSGLPNFLPQDPSKIFWEVVAESEILAASENSLIDTLKKQLKSLHHPGSVFMPSHMGFVLLGVVLKNLIRHQIQAGNVVDTNLISLVEGGEESMGKLLELIAHQDFGAMEVTCNHEKLIKENLVAESYHPYMLNGKHGVNWAGYGLFATPRSMAKIMVAMINPRSENFTRELVVPRQLENLTSPYQMIGYAGLLVDDQSIGMASLIMAVNTDPAGHSVMVVGIPELEVAVCVATNKELGYEKLSTINLANWPRKILGALRPSLVRNPASDPVHRSKFRDQGIDPSLLNLFPWRKSLSKNEDPVAAAMKLLNEHDIVAASNNPNILIKVPGSEDLRQMGEKELTDYITSVTPIAEKDQIYPIVNHVNYSYKSHHTPVSINAGLIRASNAFIYAYVDDETYRKALKAKEELLELVQSGSLMFENLRGDTGTGGTVQTMKFRNVTNEEQNVFQSMNIPLKNLDTALVVVVDNDEGNQELIFWDPRHEQWRQWNPKSRTFGDYIFISEIGMVSYNKFKHLYPTDENATELQLSMRANAKKIWKKIRDSFSGKSDEKKTPNPYMGIYFSGVIFLSQKARELLEELYTTKYNSQSASSDHYKELVQILNPDEKAASLAGKNQGDSSSSSSSSSVSSNIGNHMYSHSHHHHSHQNQPQSPNMSSRDSMAEKSPPETKSIGIRGGAWIPFVGGLAAGAALSRPYPAYAYGYGYPYAPIYSYPYGGYYYNPYIYSPIYRHHNIHHHSIHASIIQSNKMDDLATENFHKRINVSRVDKQQSQQIGFCLDGCEFFGKMKRWWNDCFYPRDCNGCRVRPRCVKKTICRARCPNMFNSWGLHCSSPCDDNICDYYPPQCLPWFCHNVHRPKLCLNSCNFDRC